MFFVPALPVSLLHEAVLQHDNLRHFPLAPLSVNHHFLVFLTRLKYLCALTRRKVDISVPTKGAVPPVK